MSYILFTNNFLNDVNTTNNHQPAETLEDGADKYSEYGLVNYKFTSLASLNELVPDPPPVELPAKMKNPITLEHVFDLPLMEVYEYLSNFDLKKKWNKGITEFEFERGKVNRIGTKHICIFDKGKAEIESVTNDFGKGNLVYGERLIKFPLAKDFTIYFILSPQEDKTKIRIEVHYQPFPIIGWLLKPIITKSVKKINKIFIHSFSKLEKENNLEDSFVI